MTWNPQDPGVLELPSGRLVRGRGLRHPLPEGPAPGLGIYLLGSAPDPLPWESTWVRWPDFRLPADPEQVTRAVHLVWDRSVDERVEVACRGGLGRTGTALACLAIVDGVAPADAVAYVRAHYSPHAVETPAQRRFVRDFRARL